MLFFLIVISFVWFGVYYLRVNGPVITQVVDKRHHHVPGGKTDVFANVEWRQLLLLITLMAGLTIVLSAVYLFLIKKFPKCMIYLSLGITLMLFAGLAIAAFLAGIWILGVILLVFLAIICCCVWCCIRRSMESAVLLLKLSATFLEGNLAVFLIPVVVAILSFIVMSVGAAASLRLMTAHAQNAGTFAPEVIYYTFFSIFLYYVTVFLIASAVGQWYYQRTTGCCTGLGNLVCSHIGSLTFGSIIITILKLIQMTLNEAQRESTNICTTICLCFVQCCMASIEALIQTLNHYAVIVMSYTGQGYVDSAKTAGVVIFSHPILFSAVSSVNGFLSITGLLFLTIVPTAVSVACGYGLRMLPETIALLGVFTFIISIIVASFFLCTLSETISSMFVFHCFDRQLQIYGVRNLPAPGAAPYSYDQLVNQDLTGQDPARIMSAAYPYVSQAPEGGVADPLPQNTYAPVTTTPVQPYQPSVVQPLYQPYNSGIKTAYQGRDYNAPGYQPSSGIGPNYQNRPYNDPTRISQNANMNPQPRSPLNNGYPQL